jgi:hypothetical protein
MTNTVILTRNNYTYFTNLEITDPIYAISKFKSFQFSFIFGDSNRDLDFLVEQNIVKNEEELKSILNYLNESSDRVVVKTSEGNLQLMSYMDFYQWQKTISESSINTKIYESKEFKNKLGYMSVSSALNSSKLEQSKKRIKSYTQGLNLLAIIGFIGSVLIFIFARDLYSNGIPFYILLIFSALIYIVFSYFIGRRNSQIATIIFILFEVANVIFSLSSGVINLFIPLALIFGGIRTLFAIRYIKKQAR